jgi:predicted alpha/beta hydrolase family esterase
MKKHILFIQGAGDGAYKEDEKLAASLRQLLGASYEVHYPKMENEIDVPQEIWVRQIKEELAALNGTIMLAGHSVGASIIIKSLSESELKKTISGIFLIAAPFWGGNGGWTYEGYEKLELPGNANTKLPKDVPVFFYHSHDDEVVPFSHLALYGMKFPKATVRELDGGGHQLNNDLSEVTHDIKTVTEQVSVV